MTIKSLHNHILISIDVSTVILIFVTMSIYVLNKYLQGQTTCKTFKTAQGKSNFCKISNPGQCPAQHHDDRCGNTMEFSPDDVTKMLSAKTSLQTG